MCYNVLQLIVFGKTILIFSFTVAHYLNWVLACVINLRKLKIYTCGPRIIKSCIEIQNFIDSKYNFTLSKNKLYKAIFD